MSTDELELARAAANLTEEDLAWVREHGPEAASDDPGKPSAQEDAQEATSQEKGSQEDDPEPEDSSDEDGTRNKVEHEWPQVGTVLEADYEGTHYEAEVISMPRYKSGKALRITTGPAAGEVERSMSGAMLTATEKLREENDLGRKGVSNGWKFWSEKEAGDIDE